jgi:hypothetical protein
MSDLRIELVHLDDESLRVDVNGESLATATHENVGWSGMDLVETIVRGMAHAAGVTVHERDEVPGDE